MNTNNRRIIASTYLSNALEFYDFTLFGALSTKIEQTFFKGVSWVNPETLILFGFCIALIVRPLGSFLFGYIGDTYSRVLSLRISIALMTLSSLILTFLPGIEILGYSAVWIVLLTRVLQGVSAGGEYNGAAIFSLESNKSKPWTISGLLTSSAMMGLVLALLASLVIKDMDGNNWRLGFLVGACIGVSSLLLRRVKDQNTNKSPHKTDVFPKYKTFMLIFLIGGQTSSLSYYIFVSLKKLLANISHLQQLDLFFVITFILFVASISSIFFGRLSEKIGGIMSVKLSLLSVIFFTPLVFLLLSMDSLPISLIILTILGIITGWHGANQHALFQTLVPNSIRQRFISIAFSLGTGILGSLTIWYLGFLEIGKVSLHYFWFSAISFLSLYLLNESLERSYGFSLIFKKLKKTTQPSI